MRTWEDLLTAFRGLPGVGLLALRSGVPVVPAGIRGTYEALAGRRFRFGAAVLLPSLRNISSGCDS